MRLTAQPELIFSSVKPVADKSPLPAPSTVPSSNAFSIQLPVEAGYKFASEQIDEDLRVTTSGMRYPPTGNPYLTVTGAALYGYGTKAVLRVDGRVSGIFGKRVTVYLSGTPSFDSGTNTLSFPNLQFSLESHNLLLKIAAWLDQVNLQQDLRNRLVFDLSKQVGQKKAQLQAALNGSLGPVALAGSVNELTLLGVYSKSDSGQFTALFRTNGTLNITWH